MRLACEAPLREAVVFLPSLPEAARRAKATWARDSAPPRSPWEHRDVRRRSRGNLAKYGSLSLARQRHERAGAQHWSYYGPK